MTRLQQLPEFGKCISSRALPRESHHCICQPCAHAGLPSRHCHTLPHETPASSSHLLARGSPGPVCVPRGGPLGSRCAQLPEQCRVDFVCRSDVAIKVFDLWCVAAGLRQSAGFIFERGSVVIPSPRKVPPDTSRCARRPTIAPLISAQPHTCVKTYKHPVVTGDSVRSAAKARTHPDPFAQSVVV